MKISRLRTLLIGFAQAATLAVLTTTAYGEPIPGGTTPSDDLLFNFDLTADLTAVNPSYSTVTLQYLFSSPDAGGGDQGGGGGSSIPVTVDIFGGVNGTDLLDTRTINILANGAAPNESELSLVGVRDGLFSVGLRVAPGVIASGSVFAFGEYTIPGGGGDKQGPIPVKTNPVAGIPVAQDTNPVPELTTLVLLGLGLAGLGLARRHTQ